MTNNNPRGHNGLRGVPDLGAAADRETAIQRAVSQAIQATAREIYVRAASEVVGSDAEPELYTRLATDSQAAAVEFFRAAGVITRE